MMKYLPLILIFSSSVFITEWLLYVTTQRTKYLPVIREKTKLSAMTCRDVFEIQRQNNNSDSEYVAMAVEFIRKAKKQNQFLSTDPYFVLGTEGLNTVLEAQPFQGMNGSNITVLSETLLDKLNWELPYLPCKLKKYEAEDIQLCVERRLQSGKRTSITYMGDSKIRQQMETLLDILHPFRLNISTNKGGLISLDDFLGFKGLTQWVKFKDRLNVTSEDLPGFFIRFIWAPDLHEGDNGMEAVNKFFRERKTNPPLSHPTVFNNTRKRFDVGAFDELNRILAMPEEDLPDLILLDSGSWQLERVLDDILDNIDLNAVSGIKKLYPLLNTLAERTSVVMMLPEPFKEYVYSNAKGRLNYFTLQRNSNLEWYLNAQVQLMPHNVQIWDSFLPVAYGVLNDCISILSHKLDYSLLPRYSRFDSVNSFSCIESIHVGYKTIYTGVQQLMNHLCNEVMVEKSKNFCCAK